MMVYNLNTLNAPQIVFGGEIIPFSPAVKDLGLHVNSSLSWNDQVRHVSKMVMGGLFSLRRFKNIISEDLKKDLVQALIFPHFFYCDVVYNEMSALNANKNYKCYRTRVRDLFVV
jgi:hypothetical protein